MLRRMAGRKELKLHELTKFGIPDMFMLPSTDRLKSTEKFLHEKAAGDLFTSYYNSIKKMKWAYEPEVNSKRADRGLRSNNSTIYFEVDRITENASVLKEKVDNYIEYFYKTEERFHVVFFFCRNERRSQSPWSRTTTLFE